jgi:hypothetical protein
MERLEEKSNNEILLEIKQLQLEHEAIKLTMLKDYDTIKALKEKMKKDFTRMQKIEEEFTESNKIILKRLKGDI